MNHSSFGNCLNGRGRLQGNGEGGHCSLVRSRGTDQSRERPFHRPAINSEFKGSHSLLCPAQEVPNTFQLSASALWQMIAHCFPSALNRQEFLNHCEGFSPLTAGWHFWPLLHMRWRSSPSQLHDAPGPFLSYPVSSTANYSVLWLSVMKYI